MSKETSGKSNKNVKVVAIIVLSLLFTVGAGLGLGQVAKQSEGKTGQTKKEYEKDVWTQTELESNKPLEYTIMDQEFANDSGMEKVKAWYDKNSTTKGVYSVNHDDSTFLLLSAGKVGDESLSIYNLFKNEKRNEIIMGYSILDNKELGIETVTNSPSVVLKVEKTDAKIIMKKIEE